MFEDGAEAARMAGILGHVHLGSVTLVPPKCIGKQLEAQTPKQEHIQHVAYNYHQMQ